MSLVILIISVAIIDIYFLVMFSVAVFVSIQNRAFSRVTAAQTAWSSTVSRRDANGY